MRKKSDKFLYQIYGLNLVSEIELPELDPLSPLLLRPDWADVSIRIGTLPTELDNRILKWSWCSASPSDYLFEIEDVAGYHIANGNTITVNPAPGKNSPHTHTAIRNWLLGSAFAALLHQRKLLPLHVSAVDTENGVWAFTGKSGEGKSTLAAYLHKRLGYQLFSDDLSAVVTNGSGPLIFAGPKRLKLWEDALAYLDFHGCRMELVQGARSKFQIDLKSVASRKPRPLRGIVLLETSVSQTDSSIEILRGSQAFGVIGAATYRPYMANWFKQPKQKVLELFNLCEHVQVLKFQRPRCLRKFDSQIQPLLEVLGRVKANQ